MERSKTNAAARNPTAHPTLVRKVGVPVDTPQHDVILPPQGTPKRKIHHPPTHHRSLQVGVLSHIGGTANNGETFPLLTRPIER